jgi:hypothetical protein
MSRCCAKQTAWCHGAAVPDKRRVTFIALRQLPERFQAKWRPVRVKKTRQTTRAFSSEVATGSRQENASNKKV